MRVLTEGVPSDAQPKHQQQILCGLLSAIGDTHYQLAKGGLAQTTEMTEEQVILMESALKEMKDYDTEEFGKLWFCLFILSFWPKRIFPGELGFCA